jgi:TRAP-type C4-dicarboxylate transport system permease small subunit
MSFIDRLLWAGARMFLVAASLAAILMCAVVFLSAVMRYFVGAPFRFSDEFVGLLFVSTSFLAMPYVLLENKHIRITLFPDRYSGMVKRVFAILASLILIVFSVIFAFLSWRFADFSLQIGARSDVGRIWLFPWMLVMPVCSLLLAVIAAAAIFGAARPRSSTATPGAPAD